MSEEILQFWKDINLLKLLQEKTKNGQKYFLLDGPPYANFTPHVGHIRNTVFKDLYIRWEFMKGKHVLFQPGFDTHGLPVENMVEKKLGLKKKDDIKKLGIANFMKTCKEHAALNKDHWMEVYELLGSWYSWKKPYLTYENEYIESAWWAFKKLWDKNMVYEGKRPVFWCPQCETALAGYETTDSYKNVTDPSIFVKFKIKDKDEYLLVFTTTPWTLPANVAIVVAPNETYVKVKTDKGVVILAKERLELLEKYELLEEFPGKQLEGLAYESLLDVPAQKELQKNDKALKIYLSIPMLKERLGSKVAMKKGLDSGDVYQEFVTVTDGSGLVHCAPGHGKTDNELGKHYDLPAVSPLDDQCKFTEEAQPYTGTFVKEADKQIIEDLEKQNSLFIYEKITHSYPLCWRCKSPLIFRLSKQWFLKVDHIKEKIIEANEKVNWQPDFARERFLHWAANADDWNFSRQRYWGIPIPIWKSESGKTIVIESKEELSKYASIPEDLHTVSEVTFTHEGEEYKRINDIFDVWYDSGSAPYASLHYPFENKQLFDDHFPISRINESQDQIRGWFYHLMFCGMGVFDKAPYETISMPGWVLDEKGEKMSKSLGNVVWAKDALKEFGADQIRFYYCWDIDPSQTQKFSLTTLKNDIRKFFTIWQNLVKLVEKEDITVDIAPNNLEDKWILSKLHSTIKAVREHIESFHIHLAGRALSSFIMDDLSRTYVQLVRNRFDETAKKLIVHALIETAKLSAAITPFTSEKIYQTLKNKLPKSEQSVHLELIPKPDINLIDEKLEQSMATANDIIGAILSARDKANIGVRWPLGEVILDTTITVDFKDIILAQSNVKKLTIKKFDVTYDLKPNFRGIGKEFGEETKDVVTFITNNKEDIIKAILEEKQFEGTYTITKQHIELIKTVPEGFAAGEFKGGSIYLNTATNDLLEAEGFAREITRRIQQLRKETGMEKHEIIEAIVVAENADKLLQFKNEIAQKVGADALEIVTSTDKALEHAKSAKIKDVQATVMIKKVYK